MNDKIFNMTVDFRTYLSVEPNTGVMFTVLVCVTCVYR